MPTRKQWIPTKLFFLSFSGLGMRLRLLKYPRSIILCFAIMHPIITTKTTLEQVLKSIVVNHGAYSSDTVKLIVLYFEAPLIECA